MAQGKFHVNKETGKSGACDAKIKCPLGEDTPHFNTEKEAKDYISAMAAEENPTFNTVTKAGGAGKGGDSGKDGNGGSGGGGRGSVTPENGGEDDEERRATEREIQSLKDQALQAREAAAKASDKLDALNARRVGDTTPMYQRAWDDYSTAKEKEKYLGEQAQELQDRLDGKPLDPNKTTAAERSALRTQDNHLKDEIALAAARYATDGEKLYKLKEKGVSDDDPRVKNLNAAMDEARRVTVTGAAKQEILRAQMERRMSPEAIEKAAAEAEQFAEDIEGADNGPLRETNKDMDRYAKAIEEGDEEALNDARSYYGAYFGNDNPEQMKMIIDRVRRENDRAISDNNQQIAVERAKAEQYRAMARMSDTASSSPKRPKGGPDGAPAGAAQAVEEKPVENKKPESVRSYLAMATAKDESYEDVDYGSFPEAAKGLKERGRYSFVEDNFSMSVNKMPSGGYEVDSAVVHGRESDTGEPILSDEKYDRFDNLDDAIQEMHNQYADYSTKYGDY